MKARARRDPEFCEALLEEAAHLLDVSRASLDGLLAAGTIPSQIICTSRLIAIEDHVTYAAKIDKERGKARDHCIKNTPSEGREHLGDRTL